MKVYYCLTKLTPKASRKREISICFANDNSFRSDEWIRKKRHVVYVREQTKGPEGEEAAAEFENRMFSSYSIFVDEKPYNGDLEAALEFNSHQDRKHVSLEEREKIKDLLRDEYYKFYNLKRPKVIKPIDKI